MTEDADKHGQQLHDQATVIDGTMVILRDYDNYLKKILESGVNGVVLTVVANENFHDTIQGIYEWFERLERNRDIVLLVERAEDMARARAEGKIGIVLAFQSGSPIESNLRYLSIFRKLGLRVMSLAYNERNLIGDGCAERSDCGLSDFGLEVVQEMNRLGVVIDLSHCGDQTMREGIQYSEKPVLISHSNARTLCDSARNIPDDIIKALAEKGGVMGINAFPGFLRKDGRASLKDFLDHIDYVKNLVGVEHVGLGLDISETRIDADYTTPDGHLGFGKTRYKPEMYPPWPWTYPQEIDSVTKFSNIAKGLAGRGYSDEEVIRILGGNYLRVFREVFTD